MDIPKDFCFCTLAVGERYRNHAEILAQDIQKYMPFTTFCILTDRPEQFKKFPHVIAFKHKLQSVKGYHDKRFVLEKALSLFESCMFLDSDIRVLNSIVNEMDCSLGITAREGSTLLELLELSKDQREFDLVQEAAQKLNVEIEKVQWLHEFIFVINRQNGLEKQLFDLWQTVSYFFELQGIHYGEGIVMGLVAARIGMKIHYFEQDVFPYFKDNIERYKIEIGEIKPEDSQVYFDVHREIEFPKLSQWQLIKNQLIEKIIFHYRLLKLKVLIKKDPYFSEIFGK